MAGGRCWIPNRRVKRHLRAVWPGAEIAADAIWSEAADQSAEQEGGANILRRKLALSERKVSGMWLRPCADGPYAFGQ